MVKTASDAGFGNSSVAPLPGVEQQEQRLRIPRGDAGAIQLNQAAQALDSVGNAAYKIGVEQDALQASQIDEAYQRDVMNLAYAPDTGLFAQQGGNAIGLPKVADQKLNELKQKYSEQASLAGPRVAQLFDKSATRTQSSLMDTVAKYSLSQQAKFRDERADATMKLSAEKIAADPANEENFQQNLATIQSAAVVKSRLGGMSAEALQLTINDAGSLAYATRASQLMQSDDPDRILAGNKFFDDAQKSGKLNTDHVNRLDAIRNAAVPKALATRAIAQTRAGTPGFGDLTVDQIFDQGVVGQESGGRQFDKNGQPLTSSAGAVGAAQVMKGTGPEAAAAAGLPWDEEKWRNDQQYNTDIGRAYFKKLAVKYDNKEMAMLAYNWGTGNVDDQIKKVGDPRSGAISMDQFIASVPSSEARNYIPGVRGKLGLAGGKKIDAETATAKATELNAQFAGAGETYLTLVNKNNEMWEKQEKDNMATVEQQAAEIIANNNGDYSKVPAALQASAMRYGLWDKLTKYDGSTNRTTLTNLMLMDDDKFVTTDLRTLASSLSLGDMEKQIDRQKKLRDGDSNFKDFTSKTDLFYASIKGKGDPEDKAQFKLRSEDRFAQFKRDNQRPPNTEEQRSMLQNLIVGTDGSTKRAYQFEPSADFAVGGIPRQEVAPYVSALDTLGFDPTDDNIEVMKNNPSAFFGDLADVPKDQVNIAVNRLAKQGIPITNGNIRSLYKQAKAAGIMTTADSTPAVNANNMVAGKFNTQFNP